MCCMLSNNIWLPLLSKRCTQYNAKLLTKCSDKYICDTVMMILRYITTLMLSSCFSSFSFVSDVFKSSILSARSLLKALTEKRRRLSNIDCLSKIDCAYQKLITSYCIYSDVYFPPWFTHYIFVVLDFLFVFLFTLSMGMNSHCVCYKLGAFTLLHFYLTVCNFS